MRITPDLVNASPQFTNPLKEREIKLRANKIPAVENLGATQDQFDVIDLSDNEIRKVEVISLISLASTMFSSRPFSYRSSPFYQWLPSSHALEFCTST